MVTLTKYLYPKNYLRVKVTTRAIVLKIRLRAKTEGGGNMTKLLPRANLWYGDFYWRRPYGN